MPAASLDLTGKWQFKEFPLTVRRMRDLDCDDWLDADVPASVFTNLVDAGRIDRAKLNADPEEFAWVSDKPWVYRKIFDAPESLLDCGRVDLVFDGLDTIASIWLNDKLIARTDNMFVAHRFDVAGLLKPNANALVVKLDPAAHHAKNLMDRYTTFSESDFNNPHRVYIRKAQYQFGWDFCPALPGCGIWRGVRLEGLRAARIADVHIRTIDCNARYADLRVAVKIESIEQRDLLCKLNLAGGDHQSDCKFTVTPDHDFHSTVIRIDNPALWWPAGYGEQPLYELNVELFAGDRAVDSVRKKVGIRTIKLDRSSPRPKSPHDDRFRFVVNNQPVHIRGANWVPASIFAGSVAESDYRTLLCAARDANFNMLRVWGGGYYEADEFYEICSELGIMLWQDFMFACAYYPDRKWFLDMVEAEAVSVIERLRNHACIALWCGNNEIDWLHAAGLLGKGRKFHGKDIYHKLLPKLTTALDPDTQYIPTTPLGQETDFASPGLFNSETTYISNGRRREKIPSRPLTSHRWDVWSGHRPIRSYLCEAEEVSPFVAEFGFQSMPDIETLRTFCPADKLRVASLAMEKHNYQIDGNSRLYRYTAELFAPTDDPHRMAYCSQIAQARAVKTHVEFLRAHSRTNGGVMFWQFNEPAGAISWSAVDYLRHPKALCYYARRFYAPVVVTILPRIEPDIVTMPTLHPTAAVAVNDSPDPLTGTFRCALIDLLGNELDRIALPVSVGPFSISSPVKLSRDFNAPADPTDCALHLLLENEGRIIAENLLLYAPDKHIEWPAAKIETKLDRISKNTWNAKLAADALAKDVRITTERPASLSDNFLDLIPSETKDVQITIENTRDDKPPVLQLQHAGRH